MVKIIKGSASDSLYFQLTTAKISHSVELHPEIVIDIAADGHVVGIDLQNVEALRGELQGSSQRESSYRHAAFAFPFVEPTVPRVEKERLLWGVPSA